MSNNYCNQSPDEAFLFTFCQFVYTLPQAIIMFVWNDHIWSKCIRKHFSVIFTFLFVPFYFESSEFGMLPLALSLWNKKKIFEMLIVSWPYMGCFIKNRSFGGFCDFLNQYYLMRNQAYTFSSYHQIDTAPQEQHRHDSIINSNRWISLVNCLHLATHVGFCVMKKNTGCSSNWSRFSLYTKLLNTYPRYGSLFDTRTLIKCDLITIHIHFILKPS